MEEIIKKAANIKLLALDVDGVLTDSKIFIANDGNEYKVFNTKDGLGLKLLLKSGVEVAIISGRQSLAVEKRMSELGIKYIYQKIDDKLQKLNEIANIINVDYDSIAYCGDDLPDLPCIKAAAIGFTVSDAVDLVKQHADYITSKPGGQGAVREICDLIMQAKNTLQIMENRY